MEEYDRQLVVDMGHVNLRRPSWWCSQCVYCMEVVRPATEWVGERLLCWECAEKWRDVMAWQP